MLVNMQRIFNDSIAGEAIVALVGGRPLVTLWINPEVYAYIARDPNSALQMYFHNASSGKELEGGGEVVDEPDLLVFMEKSVDTPPDDEVNNGGGSSGPSGVVIAVIAGGGLLLLVAVGILVILRYHKFHMQRYRHLSNSTSPVASTPEPEILEEGEKEKLSDKEDSSKPRDGEDVRPDSGPVSLPPNQVMVPPVEETRPNPSNSPARHLTVLPVFKELVSATESDSLPCSAAQDECSPVDSQHDQMVSGQCVWTQD